MKPVFRGIFLSVFIIAFMVSFACESEESDEISYLITNSSSYSITGVYVTTSGFTNWGSNRLGSSVIAPGNSYTLSLSPDYYYFRLSTSAGCNEWGVPVQSGDGISEHYTLIDGFFEACD